MPLTSVPKCIGLIMDGNRRFAKERGLSSFEGHRRGYEKLKEILRWGKDYGVSHLIVYGFSTENWNRSAEEVSYLLDLFRMILSKELEEMKRIGARIICIGERNRFPKDLIALMEKAERETADLRGLTFVLALSYGGRAEIVEATRKLLASGEKDVTEKEFEKFLWTRGIPDPDLIIRTGGEMRLSGFLPWQSVYSELFFTKTLWPDFSKEEFDSMLSEFSSRKRNFGR